MKRRLSLLLGVTMTLALLIGCGNGDDNTVADVTDAENIVTEEVSQVENTEEAREEVAQGEETEGVSQAENAGTGLKIALCVTGAVNDMGWCQSAYEGLLLVESEFGAEIAYTENLEAADMVAAFADYAANGYDIIIGHGFQFGDPALEVGELYPDVKFICIESSASAENVASYVMKCEEAGYLQGMLAASMTESGKLGFVGPIEGASLIKIMNGFEDGAKEVNPNIEVQTAWTGSFADTALAKEAATAMIENGVDVIGHCANECGTGAINAAAEAGIYAMGDSYDQNSLAPETILTSAIYNVPQLIKTAVQDVIDGQFEGTIKELGMTEGIVELAPYHGLESAIPDEVKTLIADRIEAIKSGEFVVPCDVEVRN